MEETLYRYNPWWEEDLELSDTIERGKALTQLRDSLKKKENFFHKESMKLIVEK